MYEKGKERLRMTAPEATQRGAFALILATMGIDTQGTDSVGVGCQWCGATGKMDNCQVTIDLTLSGKTP